MQIIAAQHSIGKGLSKFIVPQQDFATVLALHTENEPPNPCLVYLIFGLQ